MKRKSRFISKASFHRIYVIDKLIRNRACPSVPKLAKYIEVKPRTIERDIEYMRDLLGAPIKYCHKTQGYYYAEEDFVLPAVRLNQGELVALFLGQKLLTRHTGTPYESQVRSAFNKICNSLHHSVSVDFGAFDEWISFGVEPLRGDEEKVLQSYSQILKAIENRTTIHIKYYSAARDEQTERSIDPYHLRYFHGAWYIIAYCHWRGEVRIFALDRVHKLEESESQFTIPGDFSLQTYLDDSFGIERGEETEKVVIRFDSHQARWILEREWHHSQEIEYLPDGSLLLEFFVSGLGEVKRWVLSFGSHAEVLAPESLRQELAREISGMGKVYSGTRGQDHCPAFTVKKEGT